MKSHCRKPASRLSCFGCEDCITRNVQCPCFALRNVAKEPGADTDGSQHSQVRRSNQVYLANKAGAKTEYADDWASAPRPEGSVSPRTGRMEGGTQMV